MDWREAVKAALDGKMVVDKYGHSVRFYNGEIFNSDTRDNGKTFHFSNEPFSILEEKYRPFTNIELAGVGIDMMRKCDSIKLENKSPRVPVFIKEIVLKPSGAVICTEKGGVYTPELAFSELAFPDGSPFGFLDTVIKE